MKTLPKIELVALIAMSMASNLASGAEDHMANMPTIKLKRTFTVPTTEAGIELREGSGFGDKASEVRMMNLMMVEGSGFEGMDMAQASTAGAAKPEAVHHGHAAEPIRLLSAPEHPKVGANVLEFSISKGAKVKAEVSMIGMDMGTESPKVKEIRPGVYRTKAVFSMMGPWAVKIIALGTEKTFQFEVGK